MDERAPWYEIATGIFITLLLTAMSFAIIFAYFCTAVIIIDKAMGWNIEEWIYNICGKYPTESIVLTIVAYAIWSWVPITNIVNYLTGRK